MNLKLGDWVIPEAPGGAYPAGTMFSREILGTSYKTVVMPDGNEWMAENLSIPTVGMAHPHGSQYGSLLTYYDIATMSFSDGWSLPSSSDWINLVSSCFGSPDGITYAGRLKSTTADWNAPNTGAINYLEFSALPAGRYWGSLLSYTSQAIFTCSDTPTVERRQIIVYVLSSDSQDGDLGIAYASVSYQSVRLFRSVQPAPPIPAIYGCHDIILDSNGRAIAEANLAQRVDVRLRTFLGEHWLNPEIGVPYFSEFLVKNPNLSVCRALLLTVIQGVPGVREVTRLDLSFSKNTNARVLNVIFTVVGTDSIPQTGTTVVPA